MRLESFHDPPLFFFAKKFCRAVRTRGGTNEKLVGEYSGSWLAFFPPSPPAFRQLAFWEVVSSYSSATASGFHGIPRIHMLVLVSQRTAVLIRPAGSGGKIFLKKVR
jgi:hypothetical protein